jgi:hypothetical protein
MNLTLHQFRKDVRQFRLLLLVWGLLLISSMAANLGWVGGVANGIEQGGNNAGTIWVGAQTFVVWLLFFLVPATVVLADSPGRREGFLRTRPLPGRDLFQAKALFIVLLVMVPAVLQEVVYLALSGLPLGHIVRGAGERLLFGLPFVVCTAAYSSLWPGYARWIRSVALILVGIYVPFNIVVELWSALSHSPVFSWNTAVPTAVPSASRMLAAGYALSLALVVLAVFHARRTWNARGRWWGLAACGLVWGLVSFCWPVDLFPRQLVDPAAARAVLDRYPFTVPPQALTFSQTLGGPGDDRLDFCAYVKPKIDPARYPAIIEWSAQSASVVNATGQSFPSVNLLPSGLDFPSYNTVLTPEDFRAWARLLPPGMFFRSGLNTYNTSGATVATLGEFKLNARAGWLGEPVTFKARLSGKVYRWTQVADFPAGTRATQTDAHGAWKYFGWHIRPGTPDVQDFLVQRSQLNFATSPDALATGFSYGPSERYGFALYHPGRKFAMLTQNNYNLVSSRATATALAQYWLDVDFNEQGDGGWKALSPADLADCHLLIFEKTWLGGVPVDWQSAPVVIRDALAPLTANANSTQNGLAIGEVRRRLADLPLPGPDASRLEVGHYLVATVSIINSSQNWQPPGDAAVSRLASLVPAHLDVLLNALPALTGPAYQVVLQAITQGAADSQKDQIIAALPACQDLMPVILNRGWVTEARPALARLMAAGKPLTHATLQAIVGLQDEAAYPRLLAEFEASPNEQDYDLLRRLPGLADPLGVMVTNLWENRDPVVSAQPGMTDPVASLALHAGNREALQQAFHWLAETPPGDTDNWGLPELFWQNVYLAENQANDYANRGNLLDRMRQYGPDNFVFDPVRQHFVLKP